MEQTTIADATAATQIFNSLAGTPTNNPFALHRGTQQQSLPSGLSQSLRVSAGLPGFSSVSYSMPQAFGVRFQSNPSLSPDPPAAGPPASMASPITHRAARGALFNPNHMNAAAAVAATASSRPRGRAGRRAPGDGLASLPSQVLAPARRSQRTRKRAPTVASIPSSRDDTRDPPSKKPKRSNLKSPPPGSSKTDESEEEVKTASCCICMDEPKPADLANISGCDHLFCFECIEKWSERENTCPLCKVRFSKIDRVNKSRRKSSGGGGDRAKNTKRVKQKDQRSDLAPGAALEGLLASFASSANFPPHRVARLIFSGMGAAPFMMPGSSSLRSGRAAGAAAAARANALEDSLFSSDTDDDDDSASFLPQPSFADLFRAVPIAAARRSGPPGSGAVIVGSGLQGLRGVSLPAFDPPTGRSYASNVSDRNAGRGAENPLEIEDDSEDEEVEVVQVTRTL